MTPTISEQALKAHADRERRQKAAAEAKASAQRQLQDRLVALMRTSWNSEAAIVLFGATTDPQTRDLAWHALDSENKDWELIDVGSGFRAREIGSGKLSRWYTLGADIGDGAVLIIRLTTPDLQHLGDFSVQVDGGAILPAPDLESVGKAIRAARP